MPRYLTSRAEVLIIVLLACVPMFIHLPYRVNIFLSWEGAFRMSKGQLPFRDFGTPLGGMYWVIPAIFFKVFGPKLITLVKAQVLINIVSGLAFRSILQSLSVNKGIRLAAVILFCLSYSFFNFWPWYNHSVIVYQLVALAFVLQYLSPDATDGVIGRGGGKRWWWLTGAGLFTVFSFLTKQDGGGLALLVVAGVVGVYGWLYGRWRPLLIYAGSFVLILAVVVLIFLPYGFGYWFNHGQAPHSSRVSGLDIASEFFGSSQWIKFYCFLLLLLALVRYRSLTMLKADPRGVLLFALTLGILGEAAVLQVTSYTPPDNNIFFHSFAFACVLSLLAPLLPVHLERPRMTVVLSAGILLWWSGVWWKYTQRFTGTVYSEGYIEIMERTQKLLLAFQSETGLSISFEDTTEETFNNFVKWMNEMGRRVTYINLQIAVWKLFAEHARNILRAKINEWFDNKRFKQSAPKIAGKISLTEFDIEKLLALPLTGTDENIRDRFVMNCHNGLRISDWNSVTDADIKNGVINVITKKRTKEIAVPLTPLAKSIMAKYGGKLPPANGKDWIDHRIKIIAKNAGINDPVIYSEVVGGKKKNQKKEKWQLISCHTARRSFVTRARAMGIDSLDFDKLVAMSPAMVQRYDKITARETADKVRSNPFFS